MLGPQDFSYWHPYSAYQVAQKMKQIEATIRKLKREREAYKAAGLKEDATAVNVKIRRLNSKYKEFSEAAGLPMQKERMKVTYQGDITDSKRFAPLKEYDGEIKLIGKFSDRQYEVSLETPSIAKTRVHFQDNLKNKEDRKTLTLEESQNIINNRKLVLYQTDRQTLKFLSDNGYAVLNMNKELVTAVPEKLRSKYKKYLEGK